MAFRDSVSRMGLNVKLVLKWVILGVLTGAIGGVMGAVFHHALHFVTHLRSEHTWFVYLLPLGGLLTVAIYRIFGLKKNRGTNEIIDSVLKGESLNPLIAPVIFLATATTHLFGGSAGREGAALQLGGATASLLSRIFKLKDENRTVLIMCGMSAVFAGLFGTPLTATVFCMEFESVGSIFSPALLPCFLSAFTAAKVSGALGVHAEVFPIDAITAITLGNIWRFAILAVLIAILGIAMCKAFHGAEHFAAHHIPNPWVRIASGGALLTVMTLLVGDHRFNGAGMDMALEAVAGHADWYSFALKMLFTAVTLGAGFKGGEIVPTFCIGATFGCVVGGLLGLEPGMAAALGLVGLFCSATNSPLASIILSVEMFGGSNVHLFAFVCVICFVLAINSSLYSSQIVQLGHKTISQKK